MVLRCFYRLHNQVGSVANPRFERTQHSEDFPATLPEQEAYKRLYKKHGSHLDYIGEEIVLGTRNKIGPTRFIIIVSSSIVDETRERVELPGFRSSEQDLFAPMEMKAALQDSPRLQGKQKK